MRNTQVLVDYSLGYFLCPEGICRFPGCTANATHVVADGRYSSTNYRCMEGPGESPLVCEDHYCTCSVHKRELYGIGGFSPSLPDLAHDLGIAWKALIKLCYCVVCGKLAYPYHGEGIGTGGLQTAYKIMCSSSPAYRVELNSYYAELMTLLGGPASSFPSVFYDAYTAALKRIP